MISLCKQWTKNLPDSFQSLTSPTKTSMVLTHKVMMKKNWTTKMAMSYAVPQDVLIPKKASLIAVSEEDQGDDLIT